MGHARHIDGIAEAAHFHVDAGTSLVGVGIVNEESLEPVGQTNDSI